jgi:CheY-like chemotaxis protein
MSERKRVLVVNDTVEVLELFDEILTEMGHEVALLSYAPDELHQIRELKPDLVIVDFVIGGRELEGWQLLQKMRMSRELEHIPIIACTAARELVRESEGYLVQQGIHVLLKPFSVTQLMSAVDDALRVTELRPGTDEDEG